MKPRFLLIGIGFFALIWFLSGTAGGVGRLTTSILRFWPFLFIGAGLDLLLKEKAFKLPYLGIAALAMVGAGVVTAPFYGSHSSSEQSVQFENGRRVEQNDGGLRTVSFSEPIGEAERATVSLDLASAPVTLQALTSDEQLFDATIRDSGEFRFEAEGERERSINFAKRSSRLLDANRNASWSFGLSPQIPLSLNIDAGSGRTELDLARLQLLDMELDLGSGASILTLAQSQQRYSTEIDGGSGSLEVTIPDRADLELSADLSSGASRFTIGSGGYVVLELEGGSGSITLDVDDTANIKLEVEEDGSGALNLPTWLRQQSGDRDKGIWQTEAFKADAGQIIIRIDDRGSGSVTVR